MPPGRGVPACKERSGTARRALIRLTDQGRTAFAAHAAALERIVAAARPHA
ncbi:hypothetical protein NE236_21220 [Actinoallomurus purpureus]|uniref:hypothetical protein n=1 Tax=Actinoallomurus purpureus TaxID=478114 RepID=UPI002093C33F|nr:hypothetical protein [Actinoallomurus purpureus]MCO6007503.1 hypothetical protein [Actinoallomurus purpureus]